MFSQKIKYITAVYPENGPYKLFMVDGIIKRRIDCIKDMLDNHAKYFTKTRDGKKAEIHYVPKSKTGKAEDKYLRTDGNEILEDNLGELPIISKEQLITALRDLEARQ